MLLHFRADFHGCSQHDKYPRGSLCAHWRQRKKKERTHGSERCRGHCIQHATHPTAGPGQPRWPAPHWRPAEADRAGATPAIPRHCQPQYPHPQPVQQRCLRPGSGAFLLQAQFSASPSEIATVRSVGYAAWINAQFAAPLAPGVGLAQRAGYATVSDTSNFYDQSYPADHMIWSQLMTSTDGLRKRVALALSEICVVSLERAGPELAQPRHGPLLGPAGGQCVWQLPAGAAGRDAQPRHGVLPEHAGNQKENAATGRQPDENYAREILQLATIGLSSSTRTARPKPTAPASRWRATRRPM